MGATGNDFEAFFRKADLDGDGQISGAEAVAFFQGSGLPKNVLAQVWTYADQKKAGYLGRQEFYNALKLVTVAQSQRELTPDIVKVALYGPAASKIPAPRINIASAISRQALVPTPAPNPTRTPAPAPSASFQAFRTSTPSPLSSTIRPPVLGTTGQQYFTSPPNHITSAAQSNPHATTNQLQPAVAQLRESVVAPTSADLVGINAARSASSQVRPSIPLDTQDAFGLTPGPQPTLSSEISLPSKEMDSKESKTSAVSMNGHSNELLFEVAFSASSVNSSQSSSILDSSRSTMSASAVIAPSEKSQPSAVSGTIASLPGTYSQQNVSSLPSETQSRQISGQHLSYRQVPFTGPERLSSSAQPPWPKMTLNDINKYMKVFLQVDSDRDGKITGEQARHLFLSWRLPREILKQIWDLSDQDNDSMLSLREFCVAVYLMERYREGRALPATVPSSVISDETLLSAISHTSSLFSGANVKPSSVVRQPYVMASARQPSASAAPRPPRPPGVHSADEKNTNYPKPKMPSVEKTLLNQLSDEEQNNLNLKLQEVSEADKKVGELEKDISESRQKIEFFRSKMQELIIYKSRCDNRLNEVSARVSSDRREADDLAKKYEEKCKQAGDVASRLTLEEATFRDIQEKKMELYRAIVKMEGGGADEDIKDRVGRIQSGLEELMKSLNERCKLYGLRANPTSLVELPFGWQPGIQEGAADLDEDWDKFEEEGFTFVKDLTLDVANVVASPKKKLHIRLETSSTDGDQKVLSPNKGKKLDNGTTTKEIKDSKDWDTDHTAVNGIRKSPPGSPGIGTPEWKTHRFQDSPFTSPAGGFSPRSTENQGDIGISGGESVNDRDWSSFDSHRDGSLAFGFDSLSKDVDREIKMETPNYDISDFALNPVRTGLQTKNLSIFSDSVPSTPAYDIGRSSFPDSVPGTPAYGRNIFADSVPSTPVYGQGKNQFIFADSVPSTPSYNQGMSSYTFADSVPSTPAYNNSPRRFSDGNDGRSFDSFSRFDSFDIHDGGLFQSSNPSLARFDSMRSTGESEFGYGFNSQYDSFKESASHDQNRAFSRFDSFSSADQGEVFSRFDSFRDSDQSNAFPSTFDTFTSSKDSESSRGFSTFDSFGVKDNGESGSTFSRFDSVRDSRNAVNNFGYTSFDDADPFGSGGPFKSSVDSETPRKTHQNWEF